MELINTVCSIMGIMEFVKARYTGKKEEVPGVVTFYFLPEKTIPFKPGQFAVLNFESGGKLHSKHFTISSSPERKKIEFTTIISNSGYKQALDSLELGHESGIGKPMGKFTLDARKSDKVAFLAGGIGITPLKSILESVSVSKKPKGLEITVIHSNRKQDAIVFKEKLEEIAEKLDSVHIIHTITDENPESWHGEKGLIDRRMVKRHVDDEQNTTFFISGPPGFCQAMEKMLLEQVAVKEEMLVKETFSGY